jgi:membrane-associated protein
MPFLPGDSLLFAAGAFAALGSLNLWILMLLFFTAAVLGDAVNYQIGHHAGKRVFQEHHRFLNRNKLILAEQFYEKHGGKAIIFARFMPIMRTLAPFVAGVSRMDYKRFAFFNITGGLIWVLLFTGAGYLFGNIPAVEENFTLVIFAIIIVSFLPPVYHAVKAWFRKN